MRHSGCNNDHARELTCASRQPWLRRVMLTGVIALALPLAFAADLVIAVNSPTATADPSIGNSVPHQRILTATYETLIGIEPGSNELVPVLATEWEANEDRTSFTFTIREGVTFHDGATLDAEAVKAAFERTQAIGQGESYLIAAIDEMTVEAPYRLRIDLSRPQPEFLYAMTRMFVMSPDAIEAHADGDDLARGWFATHTAGTGPFTLTEWVEGQRYVLGSVRGLLAWLGSASCRPHRVPDRRRARHAALAPGVR